MLTEGPCCLEFYLTGECVTLRLHAFAPSSGARLSSISNEEAVSPRTVDDVAPDFCFVSGTVDKIGPLGRRALTPFENNVMRQRRRTESTLRHQHHSRISNPQLSKMGVFVVGCGVAGETGLSDLDFVVNAFCEPDPAMDAFALRAFPGDVAFDTLEEATSDIVVMQEILKAAECVFLALPCTDETALSDLNGYTATRTAHTVQICAEFQAGDCDV